MGEIFSSLALAIILSSTSVKFCTRITSWPINSRYLCNTSKVTVDKAWPR